MAELEADNGKPLSQPWCKLFVKEVNLSQMTYCEGQNHYITGQIFMVDLLTVLVTFRPLYNGRGPVCTIWW